jgi:hypothetical protein
MDIPPSAASPPNSTTPLFGPRPCSSEPNGEPAGIAALDLVVFVIPALRFVEFNLGGSLFLTDLLLLGLFIGLVACRRESWTTLGQGLPRTFIVLALLWLGAQIVTDIVRDTAFTDFARGWSKIIFTVTHFSVLYVLLEGRLGRIKTYAWGLVVGGVLAFLIHPGLAGQSYPWKFGLSYPVTVTGFLLASGCKERSFAPSILATGLGVVNLALGARSMGGVCLVAAAYLAWRTIGLRRRGRSPAKLRSRNVIAVAAVLLLGCWGAASGYEHAASAGLLGPDAQELYALQSSGDYGLLIGGRSEILIGLEAAYDSPWLGHGSWAKDPEYVELYRETMELLGYGTGVHEESLDQEANITAHSHILGAWVEAGIVGAIFWAWILMLGARAVIASYRRRHGIPLAAFCAFALLWDVLFSPFAADRRFIIPFYAVVLMTCLHSGAEDLQPEDPQPSSTPL